MKRKYIFVLSIITIMFLLVNCSNIKKVDKVINEDDNIVKDEREKKDVGEEINETDKKNDNIVDNKENDTSTEPENIQEKIDLSLNPNEAGEIMVLMYHGIDDKESTWVRSVDNFKKDLNVLYEKGYRPISLKDFVNNNINTQAGYTPVVITFDDGNNNNFNIIEKDGKKIVDPNCAVGILEEFHRKHPDFPLKATFFLNGSNPFRQKELVEYKLNYLVDKGFDIGNHTLGHNNMSNIGYKDIDNMQKWIGKQAMFLENFIRKDYKVNTYALCNGGRPENKELYRYLENGEYNGYEYKNIAILNVGWRPSVSPSDINFNPLSIQRIRASEMNVDNVGMYNWIEYFDKYPQKKFISDGYNSVVTVPNRYKDKIDNDKLKGKILYLYNKEKEVN